MSAKGRGSDVVKDENYPTPNWCCRLLFEALGQDHPNHFGGLGASQNYWLEPCAGEGAICIAIRRTYPLVKLDANEIRYAEKPRAVNGKWSIGTDALSLNDRIWDVVITNPPFSLAPAIIDHFLPSCSFLILLLRSSFKLGPWANNMPDEYKFRQRPEFIASEICKGHNAREGGCGWRRKVALTEPKAPLCPECGGRVQRSTSDSSEYSWFVWTPERDRDVGRTRMLRAASLEERRAK